MRIIIAAVCQPLAMRPPYIVVLAASSSTWNGCGSNSEANRTMSSRLTSTPPNSWTCPSRKSSQYSEGSLWEGVLGVMRQSPAVGRSIVAAAAALVLALAVDARAADAAPPPMPDLMARIRALEHDGDSHPRQAAEALDNLPMQTAPFS